MHNFVVFSSKDVALLSLIVYREGLQSAFLKLVHNFVVFSSKDVALLFFIVYREGLQSAFSKLVHNFVVFSSEDVALLSLIVIVQQSSSFVFAWLCIVLRCWLLLARPQSPSIDSLCA